MSEIIISRFKKKNIKKESSSLNELKLFLFSGWSSFERESGNPTLALSPGGPLLAYSEWIFGSASQCVFGRARERYSEILFKCSIL